ncbi:35094_t:CDS:1, partial [Gigaspora margarita]
GNPANPIIPFEIPGANWDKRLTNSSQKELCTDARRKSNALSLEAYYKLESIMAEKE